MTLDELLALAATEPPRHGDGHVFGAPLDRSALEHWQQQHPRHPLPLDLQNLLLRANGIHLWADLATGRAYEGLAPLDEWAIARNAMWGADADPSLLGDEYLAISYHTDGSSYWVLKITTGEYFLMDACGADEKSRFGQHVGDLLEWCWSQRLPAE